MIEPSSNLMKLKVISKQWAGVQDIMTLADCCESKASKLRKEIEHDIRQEGKKLPKDKVVPMARVIKRLGINEERIIKYAKIEAEMKIATD
jgi:hypothetical protein